MQTLIRLIGSCFNFIMLTFLVCHCIFGSFVSSKEEWISHGGRETLKEVGCIWPYNINALLYIMHSAPKLTVSSWLRRL